MSYRNNQYDSNRDYDQSSKPYSKKKNYYQKEQPVYAPKDNYRKDYDAAEYASDSVRRDNYTEYVAKPKKEFEVKTVQDNVYQSQNIQPSYVPKPQRDDDQAHPQGEKHTSQHNAPRHPNNSNKGHKKKFDSEMGPSEHPNKERSHKNYAPKKPQNNPDQYGDASAENAQSRPDKNEKPPKDKRRPSKQKNEKQVPEGQAGEEGSNLKSDKQRSTDNIRSSGNSRNSLSKEEQTEEKGLIKEKDTFEYDEEMISEITSMMYQAALDIPDVPRQTVEAPKDLNKIASETLQNPMTSSQEEQKIEKDTRKEKKDSKDQMAVPKKKKDEEQPQPKKVIDEKNQIIKWLSREYFTIYHKKRSFLELYQQLNELWHEVYLTLEDDDATYDCIIAKMKPNFFHSYSLFIVIFFHLLVEKQLYHSAVDLYYRQTKMIEKESQFCSLIVDAVQELEAKIAKQKGNRGVYRANRKITGAATLADFGRKIEDVNVIDKFDKSGKRFIRIGALEKIKKEEQIAVHFERNEHQENYLSIIQIATRNEVFVLDIERICKFDDNILALLEFFSILFAKRSSVMIVMEVKKLCQGIIDSLYIANEKDNKEFVEKKKELSQVLDRYENHFTDLAKLGVAKNVRELFQKVLDLELDERQRFGDWYKRPLSDQQIELTAIEVSGLFACYDKLFGENLGAEIEKVN